ncbi:MAG TPA: hypothetical protein ENO40_06695 [Desulfurella acetivorans]|uniref:hypothetical protein n=1 Tax=Desulfurella sp. TaxID=1962857 RepID=UPI0017540AAC|nr:hypothetical protein [Desulfurella acetivorans]
MPFGDGRGPLWANDSTYAPRWYGRGLGRGLGRARGFWARGFGWGYRSGFGANYDKELLEEEKRYLQDRLREIDSLLNR